MDADIQFRRAQVYRFLAEAFIYPRENWLEDLPEVASILHSLDFDCSLPLPAALDLEGLQKEFRHSLGLSGSLPYETEIGLPNEFRQSQEMADIAGFYRAFGFSVGGPVRERADHLATELEFMCLLALKEAYAAARDETEPAEICRQAQQSFLHDHLGCWIGLFAQGLERASGVGQEELSAAQPYRWLARLGADFVSADAQRMGVDLASLEAPRSAPTPLGPDLSCESCPAAG